MAAKKTGEPGWAWRRSVLIGVILISFLLIWFIINGPDSRVNESVSWGLIIAIISSSLIYAGFATVQDVAAILATKSALPYSPQSSPAEPTPGTPAPDVVPE